MRKLVSSCFWISSSGVSSRSCYLALLEIRNLAGKVVVVGLHGGATGRDLRKARASCPRPAGLVRPGRPLFVGRRALVAHVDRGRRALEDVELADDLRELRDRLHRRRAGADDADRFAAQVDVVVPARGVERLALERLHAVDARQLRRGQDAVGQDHEARAHRVAAIGLDDPAAGGLVPGRPLDRGVEQAVLVEAELLGQALAVLKNLEARRELHRRDVAGLFEQRQVAVGFHVAGDARIAVPVPGAADVAALLAEAHVGEAGLAQLVPQQQAAEAGADHQDLALVGQRLARDRRLRIDVVQVFRELAFHAPCSRRRRGGLP